MSSYVSERVGERLIQLVLNYPSQIGDTYIWNHYQLSTNSNINLKLIKKYPQIYWDKRGCCNNPNITFSEIIGHPELLLNITELSRTHKLTLEFILDHVNDPLDWGSICTQPCLNYKIIKKHGFDKKIKILDFYNMFCKRNINLSFNDVLLNPNEEWNAHIGSHPNISLEIIETNLEFFHGFHVANNPNIDWENYQTLCNQQNWHLDWYSKNPNITIDIVVSNLHITWNWLFLSENKSLSFEDITAYPQLLWWWSSVCDKLDINWDFIESHLHTYNWNWHNLGKHPKTSLKRILKHFDIFKNYIHSVSQNPNITFEFIEANINVLDKTWLSGNPLTFEVEIMKFRCKWAAKKIQYCWKIYCLKSKKYYVL